MAALFFVLGVAHGAVIEDRDGIRIIGPSQTLAYLFAAAAVAAFWMVAPLSALALFLSLSLWHFTVSDTGEPGLARFSVAALAIGGSALFQPDATRAIFAAITGATIPAPFLAICAGVGVAGLAAGFLAASRALGSGVMCLVCALATLILHPVLAVAFVFFALHALPVTARLCNDWGSRAFIRACAAPTVVAIVGVCAIGFAVTSGVVPVAIAAGIVAGLATPHMLTDRFDG